MGNKIYKCDICGNVIEMLHDSGVSVVCCGQDMRKLEEKNSDTGKEKHVPIVEKTRDGIKVRVGSVEHPMEPSHWIQWIEVISNGKSYKQFLKPGMKPEAEFCLKNFDNVREYCNIHELWGTNS